MKFSVAFIITVFTFGLCFAFSEDNPKEKKKPVSFSKDVFPIVKKRCLPCHAEDSENPSNFFLESYTDLMNGGKHGAAVIPKKGDDSYLVQKLKPGPSFGEQMPLMSKKKLTDEEVQVFKDWIDQGAKKN